MKASARAVLLFLLKQRRYVTSAEVIRAVYTTTPSKRLDELHDAGLIEKRWHPEKPRTRQYRAGR
jgi:DNA-binding HxlR family transcriptional regulator